MKFVQVKGALLNFTSFAHITNAVGVMDKDLMA